MKPRTKGRNEMAKAGPQGTVATPPMEVIKTSSGTVVAPVSEIDHAQAVDAAAGSGDAAVQAVAAKVRKARAPRDPNVPPTTTAQTFSNATGKVLRIVTTALKNGAGYKVHVVTLGPKPTSPGEKRVRQIGIRERYTDAAQAEARVKVLSDIALSKNWKLGISRASSKTDAFTVETFPEA